MSCFCFNDWYFISWCVGVSCMFFIYNGGVGFLRFLKLFVCARVLGLSVDLDLVSYCFRRSSRGKTFFILNCGGWIYATSGKTVTSRKSLNLHFFFNDSVQLYFALYHQVAVWHMVVLLVYCLGVVGYQTGVLQVKCCCGDCGLLNRCTVVLPDWCCAVL